MKPKEDPKLSSEHVSTRPGELSEKLNEWMAEETRNPSWEGELMKRIRRKVD
jgi:hypothetical protein